MLFYCHVIVYSCVHQCILYARNNKQLVLGYVVARLDERERMVVPSWTWQLWAVCSEVIYIVLESKFPSTPLLPLEGQIHRLDRMLHKVSNHSKKPNRRNRGEKYRGEEEDQEMGNFWLGKWRSWTNRRMREILLLVVLDVNPTWISRKGEAERKFLSADVKIGKS